MADFGFDIADDDDEPVDQSKDSTPFKQLRAQNRQLQKDIKERDASLDALMKFKASYDQDQKASSAASVFEELGLPKAQAKAFVALFPDQDVTADTVRSYALEYGLALDEGTAPAKEKGSFKPLTVASSSPATQGIAYADYQVLLKENPQSALQAVSEGRVQGLMSTPREG